MNVDRKYRGHMVYSRNELNHVSFTILCHLARHFLLEVRTTSFFYKVRHVENLFLERTVFRTLFFK